ncbi:hypothetical protein [Maricaulis sp.]|uniref:hypothetical protein n=1 Tax=unclassified Maricaulis TaxID=2632371 RepID=UPI001AFDB3D8|nr:hypothetical protein [Maricaulis sp.]MBO6797006.1 hypothetical protein [Maricaulis sp.]
MDESCTGFVIYGLNEGVTDTISWLKKAIELFEQAGVQIDKCALAAPGFSGKLVSFTRSKGKIASLDEGVGSFQLVGLTREGRHPVFDFRMYLMVSLENGVANLVAESALWRQNESAMADLVELLVGSVPAGYGFEYERARSAGVVTYALGRVQGNWDGSSEDSDSEHLNISFWNHARREAVWKHGQMRSVYLQNYLNRQHLKRPIEGMSLETWISAGEHRGHLRQMSRDMWVWDTREADRDGLRRALWREGILFNWAKDLEGASKHPNAGEITIPWGN